MLHVSHVYKLNIKAVSAFPPPFLQWESPYKLHHLMSPLQYLPSFISFLSSIPPLQLLLPMQLPRTCSASAIFSFASLFFFVLFFFFFFLSLFSILQRLRYFAINLVRAKRHLTYVTSPSCLCSKDFSGDNKHASSLCFFFVMLFLVTTRTELAAFTLAFC